MPESNDPALYIAARQSRCAPRYYPAPEQWRALFGVACDLSTAKLRQLAEAGTIASGEIGDLTPSTYVTRCGRGYAVVMHSGSIMIIYSAARAIIASDGGRFRDDKSASLSLQEVAQKVADLFWNFKQLNIATVQAFAATLQQTNRADAVARGAERFLLMHELAHIHNGDLAWWRRYIDFGGDARKRESAADKTACGWLFDYLRAPKEGGPQRQVFYTGAEFALRIRMAMEKVGLEFEPTHPSAGDRIAAMRTQLRAAVGSREFYAIASPALAFDQMWRAIELILKKARPDFARTRDDVIAGLRTLTVELLRAEGAKGIKIEDIPGQPGQKRVVFSPVNDVQKEILKAAENDFRDLPSDLRAEVRQHVGDVFEAGSVEFSIFHMLLALSEPKAGPQGGSS